MPTGVARNKYLVPQIGASTLGSLDPASDWIYPDWASLVRGTAEDNANALKPRQFHGVPLTTPASISANRYSVQRLTKNPALEDLLGTNIGRVRSGASANDDDFARYLGLVDENTAENRGDLSQEGNFIDEAFDGTLGRDLAGSRDRYSDAARATNANAGSVFSELRRRYGDSANALIDKLAADLGTQRGAYEGRTLGEIAGEEGARRGLRGRAFAAERAGADVGIDTAFRDWKGQQGGNTGSTYALRSLAAPRAAIRASLAANNAAVERGDYEVTRGQRANLTDRLAALERGDITSAGTARLGLNENLGAQERGDFGYTLGREEGINRDIANQERGDITYVRDAAGRLIGVRRGQRAAAAADALQPISVRNSLTETELRNAGTLGQLDEANNFYSVRDGVGENYRPPRIPNYSRGRTDYDLPELPDYGGYFTGPQDGGATNQPVRNARGGVGTSPQTAAREYYFQQTGVYPENDPNFSEQAWRLAQRNAALPPNRGYDAVPAYYEGVA